MFWGDGGEHGEEEGKRERECERQGIGTGVMLSTIVVERGEEWRKKGRTDAKGWKGVTVDWGEEPGGWRRTRPKRARAKERYKTITTSQVLIRHVRMGFGFTFGVSFVSVSLLIFLIATSEKGVEIHD